MAQKVKCDKIKVGKNIKYMDQVKSFCPHAVLFSVPYTVLCMQFVWPVFYWGKKKAVAKVNVFWCPLVWLITVEVDLSRAKSFINMERKSVAFLLNDLGVWIKLKHPDTLFSGGH